MTKSIYMDYNASTPLDPLVWQAMRECYARPQVNAGSITHGMGRQASTYLETARQQIAASIGAESRDIIFCSGATEAINIALMGVAMQYKDKGRHIICAQTEHRAVLACLDALEQDGWEIARLAVNNCGYINLDDLRQAIRPDTVLCAVMHVNNETGIIQDIQAIAEICSERDVRFFVDAAQSWGKLSINAQQTPFDALAISSHKNYGPQGIGALYIRRKPKRLRLQALIQGGGQERGVRSGTVPVALACAMGVTAQLSAERMEKDCAHNQALRAQILVGLERIIPQAVINGDREAGIAGTLNIQIPGVDAQDLLCACPDLALSMGSACTSSVAKPSHVLSAMGLNWQAASASLRMSYGRMTSAEEIDRALHIIQEQLAAAVPSLAGTETQITEDSRC